MSRAKVITNTEDYTMELRTGIDKDLLNSVKMIDKWLREIQTLVREDEDIVSPESGACVSGDELGRLRGALGTLSEAKYYTIEIR